MTRTVTTVKLRAQIKKNAKKKPQLLRTPNIRKRKQIESCPVREPHYMIEREESCS